MKDFTFTVIALFILLPFFLASSTVTSKPGSENVKRRPVFNCSPSRILATKVIQRLTEYTLSHSDELGTIIDEISQVSSWKAMSEKSMSSFPEYKPLTNDENSDDPSHPDRIVYYIYSMMDLMIRWNHDFLPSFFNTIPLHSNSEIVEKLMNMLLDRVRNDLPLLKSIIYNSITNQYFRAASELIGLLPDIDMSIHPSDSKVSALATAIDLDFFSFGGALISRGANTNQLVHRAFFAYPVPLFFEVLRKDNCDKWHQVFLEDEGFDITACVDERGTNALHIACIFNTYSWIIMDLVDTFGINSVSKRFSTSTPLSIAIQRNHADLAIELMGIPDVDLGVLDRFGNSLLHLAAIVNSQSIVSALLSYAYKENIPSLKLDYTNFRDASAFSFAIFSKSYESLAVMVSKASSEEVNFIYTCGCSPLIIATCRNDSKAVEILLSHPEINCNIPLPKWLKQTKVNVPEPPLFLALSRSYLEISHLLAPLTIIPKEFMV